MVRATGLGSGLDVESIVTQLLASDGAATTARLNKSEAGYQSKLSAYGTLKGALADFQKSLTGLKDLTALRSRSAKVSDETSFTAQSGETAVPGTYEIEITTLAQAHRLMSQAYLSSTTPVGTGTMTITSGSESFDVAIDAAHQTLAGIRDSINQAEGNNSVDATIINVDDGLGGRVSKLVLAAKNTGLTNAIQVEVTGDGDLDNLDAAGLSGFTFDPGVTERMTEQQPAVDAKIKVFNQVVTRSSNKIDDAIDGLTLTLTKAAPGTVATVTVSEDRSALRDRVSNFVKSYNSAIDSMRGLSKFDGVTKAKGALLGDPTLRTIESRLRRMVSEAAGGDGLYTRLSDVGIKTDANGHLELDNTALQKAVDSHYEEVGALFGGDEGFGTKLETLLDGYTDTTGILQTRVDGLNKGIKDIGEQRTALQSRLTTLEARYRAEFDSLDQIISQLTSTGTFLTQQLASLPGFTYNENK